MQQGAGAFAKRGLQARGDVEARAEQVGLVIDVEGWHGQATKKIRAPRKTRAEKTAGGGAEAGAITIIAIITGEGSLAAAKASVPPATPDPLNALERPLPAPVVRAAPVSGHTPENSDEIRDARWHREGTKPPGPKKKPEAQLGNLASGFELTGAGDGSSTHDNCVGNAGVLICKWLKQKTYDAAKSALHQLLHRRNGRSVT